jgi:uncharacterized membrane protein YdjX (TVP38/TMEM64 family)
MSIKLEGDILNRKVLILLLLIVIGFIIQQTNIADWRHILEQIEKFSDYWWVWTLVLGTKVVFYALAMPGSWMIWIAAILYNPVQATIIIIGGGTIGGLLGYFLSKRLSQKDKSGEKDSIFFGFLQKNSNFLALCAARIIPGFPHSVINYGSGILGISLPKFLLATLLGFAVKGFVYSSAIHEAIEVSGISEMDKWKTVWPLLILAGLMVIGHVFQRFFIDKRVSRK